MENTQSSASCSVCIETKHENGSSISNSYDAIRQAMGETYAKIGLSEYPSCPAPEGIMYDFCWGLRIYIPDSPQREYHVQFWDMEDEKLSFDSVMSKCGWIQATKHYYRPYFIRISDNRTGDVLFEHKMNLKNQIVLMYFPVDTIGDTIAWFKSVEEFQKKHECFIYVSVAPHLRKLLEKAHPTMRFIEREQCRTIHPYASYMFGVSYDDDLSSKQMDFRTVPLHWRGADILGLDPHPWQDEPPLIDFDKDSPSPFDGHYVAISSMASGGCKLWLNPNGWGKVIKFLKHYGYRVIDIDGRIGTSSGFITQFIPRDAEDFTGTGEGCSLQDRAKQIYHADFFIGLGSGLSWLAWCVKKPIVLISGFSQPWCEFYTPYRVINSKVCHGCFNDVRYTFDPHDCFWCPKHKGTDRQLECSTQITAEQVIRTIQRIPEFQSRLEWLKDMKNEQTTVTHDVVDEKETFNVVDGKIADSKVNNVNIDANDKKTSTCMSIKPGMKGASGILSSIQKKLDATEKSRNVDTYGNSVNKSEKSKDKKQEH